MLIKCIATSPFRDLIYLGGFDSLGFLLTVVKSMETARTGATGLVTRMLLLMLRLFESHSLDLCQALFPFQRRQICDTITAELWMVDNMTALFFFFCIRQDMITRTTCIPRYHGS